jgi:hypothetical protein
MKRLTVILCVLSLLGIACYAWARSTVVSVVQGAAAVGVTYSDIVFWLGFEANDTTGDYNMGSDDCVLTGGDNSGTYISAATISGTNCKVGSYCLAPTSGDDGIEFNLTNMPTTKGRIGFWLYNSSAWAEYDLVFTYGNTASNENYIQLVTYSATDELSLSWRGVGSGIFQQASTTANLTTSTHYFIEIAWDTTLGGTDYCDVYVNGTRFINHVEALDAVVAGKFAFSLSDTGMRIDNFMVSTDPTRDLYESGTGLSVATTKPSGACP